MGKILITSALPYVNNIPHLGNIIGSVLSADVFARFMRSRGHEVLYICGADEHGTATETKAKEEGVTPEELCDKYYKIHEEIYKWFNISFDSFGRTSTQAHKEITQELFNKANENGFIEKDTVTQPFCIKCNTFLADRFIEGVCPHCQYEDARGDQCDKCGKLLNPQELVNPRCKVDGSTPEFRSTDHLFLCLDKLQPILEQWVKTQSTIGKWTENSIRTTKAWFKEGLKKRAITRDLKWGIPVPEDAFNGEFKDKVFYVWFDAPIGYISITANLTDEWKDWWENKDVKLYQFMGKDNIPFHSIIFPATLMAADNTTITDGVLQNSNHTMIYHLNSTEYLNYENGKFSKSRGVGVFGDNAKESGIPADVFRYVLLYNRPESSDTQFTWKGLQERLNNELVANFGNLVNRTISFTNRFLDNKIPELDEYKVNSQAIEYLGNHRRECEKFVELMDQVKLRESLNQFMKISSLANQFFQESQPWKSKDENKEKCSQDLFVLCNTVKDLAIMIEPFLPTTSQDIFRQLAIKPRTFEELGQLTVSNHTLNSAQILFKKLEDKDRKVLQSKYGGQKKVPKAETESILPTDIEFVVGKITSIELHAKADKLYIEQVDIGSETIQIVSGLVPYFTKEDLLDKHIIVVKNLQPAKLRGVMSNGMLLAAENKEGTVGLITVDAPPGTKVGVNTKEKPRESITVDEFFSLQMKVTKGVVYIEGNELKSDTGTIHVHDVIDGVAR